ncbi:hypothetical protein QTP86_031659, partial [Hemibagrus guttatus]
YLPLINCVKPTKRIIKVWPVGADTVLQDRFQHTDWSMFTSEATCGTHTDINTYTSSVLDYINTTIDSVTTEKQITTYPNQKPWMNKEVRLLLEARNAAFRSDNKEKSISTRPSADHQPFTLTSTDVCNVLNQINARKAAGPNGIPGRVLRACAEQLAGVFTDIFNLSLAHSVMPTYFKSTSISPVPKHSSPKCPNDYRPVALTPIVMKCFERLVLAHLKK